MKPDSESFISGQRWKVHDIQERAYLNPKGKQALDDVNVHSLGAQFCKVLEAISRCPPQESEESSDDDSDNVCSKILRDLRGIVWSDNSFDVGNSMLAILRSRSVEVEPEDCAEIAKRFAQQGNPWLFIQDNIIIDVINLREQALLAGCARAWDGAERGKRKAESDIVMRWLNSSPGHNDEIFGIALSRDATLLATFSKEPKIIVWHLSRGEQCQLQLANVNSRVCCAAFVETPQDNSDLVSLCCSKHSIQLWACNWLKEPSHVLLVIQDCHAMPITCISVSRDGSHAWTASYDCTVAVWDIGREKNSAHRHFHATQRIIASHKIHQAPVTCIDASPEGGAVSGSQDWTAAVFSDDLTASPLVLAGHHSWVTAVSGGAGRATSSSLDGDVCLWRTVGPGRGDILMRLSASTLPANRAWVRCVGLRGELLFAHSDSGEFLVWSAVDGKRILQVLFPETRYGGGSCRGRQALALSGCGTFAAVCSGSSVTLIDAGGVVGGFAGTGLPSERLVSVEELEQSVQISRFRAGTSSNSSKNDDGPKGKTNLELAESDDDQMVDEASIHTSKSPVAGSPLAGSGPSHRFGRRGSVSRPMRNSISCAEPDDCEWTSTEGAAGIQVLSTIPANAMVSGGTRAILPKQGVPNSATYRDTIVCKGIYTWEIQISHNVNTESDLAFGVCVGIPTVGAILDEYSTRCCCFRAFGGTVTVSAVAAMSNTGTTMASPSIPIVAQNGFGCPGDKVELQLNLNKRKLRFRITGTDRCSSIESDVQPLLAPLIAGATASGAGVNARRFLADPGIVPFIYFGCVASPGTIVDISTMVHESAVKESIRKYMAKLSTLLEKADVVHEVDVLYAGCATTFDCRPYAATSIAIGSTTSAPSPIVRSPTRSAQTSSLALAPSMVPRSTVTGKSDNRPQQRGLTDAALVDPIGASSAFPSSSNAFASIGSIGRVGAVARQPVQTHTPPPVQTRVGLQCGRGAVMRSTKLRMHVITPPSGSEEACESKWTVNRDKMPWGRLVGLVVDIRPHGINFIEPVILQLPHSVWFPGEEQYQNNLQVLHLEDFGVVAGLPNRLFSALSDGLFNKDAARIPIKTTGVYCIKAGASAQEIVQCALYHQITDSDIIGGSKRAKTNASYSAGHLDLNIDGQPEQMRLVVGSALGPLLASTSGSSLSSSRLLVSGLGRIHHGARICKLCCIQSGTILGGFVEISAGEPSNTEESQNGEVRAKPDSHTREADANLSLVTNIPTPSEGGPVVSLPSHEINDGASASLKTRSNHDEVLVHDTWMGGNLQIDLYLRARKSSADHSAFLLNAGSDQTQSARLILALRGHLTEWNRWNTDPWPAETAPLMQILKLPPFAFSISCQSPKSRPTINSLDNMIHMSPSDLGSPLQPFPSAANGVNAFSEQVKGVDIAVLIQEVPNANITAILKDSLRSRGWTFIIVYPDDSVGTGITHEMEAQITASRACLLTFIAGQMEYGSPEAMNVCHSHSLFLHGLRLHGPKNTVAVCIEESYDAIPKVSNTSSQIQAFTRAAAESSFEMQSACKALFSHPPVTLHPRKKLELSAIASKRTQEQEKLHERILMAIPTGPFGSDEERRAFFDRDSYRFKHRLALMDTFNSDPSHHKSSEDVLIRQMRTIIEHVGLGTDIEKFESIESFLSEAGAKEDDLWAELQGELGLEVGPDDASALLSGPFSQLLDFARRHPSSPSPR